MPVSGPPALANAITTNNASTTSWKNTRTNWTFSVVVMPR